AKSGNVAGRINDRSIGEGEQRAGGAKAHRELAARYVTGTDRCHHVVAAAWCHRDARWQAEAAGEGIAGRAQDFVRLQQGRKARLEVTLRVDRIEHVAAPASFAHV